MDGCLLSSWVCFLCLFLSLFFLFCILSQLLFGQIAKIVSHSDLLFALTAWYRCQSRVPPCCRGCQRKTITIIALDYFKHRAASNPRHKDCSDCAAVPNTSLELCWGAEKHGGAAEDNVWSQKKKKKNIWQAQDVYQILMRSCYNWTSKSALFYNKQLSFTQLTSWPSLSWV